MDISNIYDAKEVLKDVISKTPLVHADKLHENLWIKAEICREPVPLSCVELTISCIL